MGRRVSELAQIPFNGSLGAVFDAYARQADEISQKLAFEFEVAAGDSRAAMESLHGHPLLFGLDVRVKARRVAKRLKRASELADGIGHEAYMFHSDYRKHFHT